MPFSLKRTGPSTLSPKRTYPSLYFFEIPSNAATFRLRLKTQRLIKSFFEERFNRALELRDNLSDEGTTGYRIINGENDGFPGLVLDRYEGTVVIKLYTSAWIPYLDTLITLFKKKIL